MNKRSIGRGVLAGLAAVCLAAPGCSDRSLRRISVTQAAAPAALARFVTIPDVFDGLERPPVRFDHDKHTRALKTEGCKACHRADRRGDFLFTFPSAAAQSGKTALMNAFHDDCIGCHTRRTQKGEKAGPVTCGECHVVERAYHEHQYVPMMPDYYEVLRDTYHSNCLSCHGEPSQGAQHAGPLDWKRFYVQQAASTEAQMPKVSLDYLWHDKHDRALEGKCELCHSISPQKRAELKAQGKEPAGQDWVWDVDEKNSLTERTTAHARCINCHLGRSAKAEKAGPTQCGECHSGARRAIQALAQVARPKCSQEDMMLIDLGAGARAKAVAFNHRSHVASSRSCQECHHKTLRPCADCHTPEGSEKGNWITLAEAHHRVSSSLSCVGCHEAEKSKTDCAGCHQFLPRGLVQTGCRKCHTGSLEGIAAGKGDRHLLCEAPEGPSRQKVPVPFSGGGKLPAPGDLIAKHVKDKIEIRRIEDLYAPATVPHLAMARRLTDISNRSALASYFHTDPMTVCAGCHHLGPLEPQAEVPSCATCHTARREPTGGTSTLLGAYHQRCLGCHHRMDPGGRTLPQTCTGCHKEKAPRGKHLAAQLEK